MESEVALPKATVKQIISKHLSANLRSSASGISETIAELAQEKAHQVCLSQGKKMIMPEHVITAMNESGFAVDQQEIDNLLNDLNKRKASTPKEQLKLKKCGMSEDQLLEEQEKLLLSAKSSTLPFKPEELLEEDNEEYD